jgi:hypothetical protein
MTLPFKTLRALIFIKFLPLSIIFSIRSDFNHILILTGYPKLGIAKQAAVTYS